MIPECLFIESNKYQMAYKLKPKAVVDLVYWIWAIHAGAAVLYVGYMYGDPDAMSAACIDSLDADCCFWGSVTIWMAKWVFLVMLSVVFGIIVLMLLTGAAMRLFDKVDDGTPGSFELKSPITVRQFNNFMFKLLGVEIVTVPIAYFVYCYAIN